jgi:hypothetical protein
MKENKKNKIIKKLDLNDSYLTNLDVPLLKRELINGYYIRKIEKYQNFLKKVSYKHGTEDLTNLFKHISRKERETLEDKLFELLDLESKIPRLLKFAFEKTAEDYIKIINGPRESNINNPFYDFYNKNKR